MPKNPTAQATATRTSTPARSFGQGSAGRLIASRSNSGQAVRPTPAPRPRRAAMTARRPAASACFARIAPARSSERSGELRGRPRRPGERLRSRAGGQDRDDLAPQVRGRGVRETGEGEGRKAQAELERPPSARRYRARAHSAATSCGASARTRRTVPACAPTSFDTTSCSPRPSQCWSTLFQRSPMARSCPVSSRAIGFGKTTMSGFLDAALLGGLAGEDLPALGRPAREDLRPRRPPP